MALAGVEAQQFLQTVSSITQAQKQVPAANPRHDMEEKTKEQQEPGAPSPIQDHVTLSKEAQALSASDPQASKNNTFQGSPSSPLIGSIEAMSG